jgi:hypothetical protein
MFSRLRSLTAAIGLSLPVAVVAVLAATVGCGPGERPPAALNLPVEIANNLIFVAVREGQSEPLSFILDTGASATVMNRSVADRLGLSLKESEDARTGGGSVETATATGVTMHVGSASLTDVTIVAIDLSGLQTGLGRPVDGILGYDIFRRYVVQIDYAGQSVSLIEPAEFRPGATDGVVPIVMEDRIPFAQIQVVGPTGEASDAKVEFDTGQTGAMTLVKPFVDARRLVAPEQPVLRIRTGAILSGGVAAEVARISGVRLGRFLVSNVVVNVTPAAEGAGVTGATVGLLGGEILRRFTVTVDYAGQRVVLVPNAQFDAPMEFDMSGMSLAALPSDPSVLRVRSVIDQSPASEAGVAVGDLLMAIDGAAVHTTTLTAIRQRFRMPNVKSALTLKRGDRIITLTLTTRRLI